MLGTPWSKIFYIFPKYKGRYKSLGSMIGRTLKDIIIAPLGGGVCNNGCQKRHRKQDECHVSPMDVQDAKKVNIFQYVTIKCHVIE